MWTLRQITQKVKEVNDIYANATADVIRIVTTFLHTFYNKNSWIYLIIIILQEHTLDRSIEALIEKKFIL